MTDDVQSYNIQAEIGQQAEMFWDSDIGKYVLDRAKKETDAAVVKYKDVDPEDAKAVRKLQNEVDRPARAITWLRDAIIEGQGALHVIQTILTPSD